MGRPDFCTEDLLHIYQRSWDRGVIFYSIKDRIVYYTLAATKSKQYGVTIVAASIMFTHTHQSVYAPGLGLLRKYLMSLNSSFSRLYNHRYKRKGPLFDHDPGRAGKRSSKDKRSNIIYVYNNHVEKGLCEKAVQYRWSFLAYAKTDFPFSSPPIRSEMSTGLTRYLRLVDRRIRKNKALEYHDLDKIFATLSTEEKNFFVDYVISRYRLIDFNRCINHFNDLNSLIRAVDSTTGGEYDINEEYTKFKDTAYVKLLSASRKQFNLLNIYSMNEDSKADMMNLIYRSTNISRPVMKKFFHVS